VVEERLDEMSIWVNSLFYVALVSDTSIEMKIFLAKKGNYRKLSLQKVTEFQKLMLMIYI
jgi:hypothetical protein